MISLSFINLCLQPVTHIVAKGLAIRHGSMLCHDLGLSKVMVQTDYESLVKIFHAKSSLANELGMVLGDIRFLAHDFIIFNVTHCPRLCNLISLNLAKATLSFDSFVYWHNDICYA